MLQSGEFGRAVAEALASGGIEIERLVAQAEELTDAYGLACRTSKPANRPVGDFDGLNSTFAERVRQHVTDQADVLSTFNIAFFGRTGAGKSTLLSALGQLDGSAVSPGDSDWTTTVQTIDWHGCRLYDTPGINGWGGRKSRDELEAVARRAVEVADVVLLCFDSQSQQASEFAKVADWVRHYGKPTIAVLNIRNLRWRHPAKISDQVARQNISTPVRQHRDNIQTELSNIGLQDTPVVAIHSRRALFARASRPYRGPADSDFLRDREQFGIDYLAQWSNIGVLESLLTALITGGGSQLRLTSLREGMRAIVRDEATNLESLHRRLSERADEIDRAVSGYLKALGHLDDDERSCYLHDDEWCGDLLTLAESARGSPYRAGDSAFSSYVRTLLKAQLAEPKSDAIRRFKELERRAFEENQNIDQEAFAKEVFGESDIQTALNEVWKDAAAFLERELELATADLGRDAQLGEREGADLTGSAGSGDRLFEKALLSSRTLSGAGVLAFAIANIWNPAGWVAGLVLAGVGVATQVMGWIGNKRGADAE